MKILILGAQGYMGQHFSAAFADAATPSVDIADPKAVQEALDTIKPELVINCAGKTGKPNVDWCEDHQEETYRSNVEGVKVLLKECDQRNVYWVHLSTGCIYEGNNGGKGFSEDDSPNFSGSTYSRSKAEADKILRESNSAVLNLRLRMPFGPTPDPRNLITKLTQYSRVLDAENSLTCVPDFIQATLALIAKKAVGTFNVVNPGGISPYRVMQLYQELVDPTHIVERLTLEELPNYTVAGRSNCILSTAKLQDEGIVLPVVESAVIGSLKRYKSNK